MPFTLRFRPAAWALASLLLLPALPAWAQSGTVRAWGNNQYGAATVPAGLTDVVQLDNRGEYSLALKADGTVVAWGGPATGLLAVPAGLADVVHVDAGGRQAMALRRDGSVVLWGGMGGQRSVPAGIVARDVASGRDHAVAVRTDGTVVAWGQNLDGATAVPAGLTDVVQVDAGDRHTLALRADGTVACWGQNRFRQCDVPAGLTDVVQVAAGWAYSLALRADGTVVGWGGTPDGAPSAAATPPAGLSGVVSVTAGQSASAALRADGSVVTWGDELRNVNIGQKTPPAELTSARHVAFGNQVALAIEGTRGTACPPPGTGVRDLPLRAGHRFVPGMRHLGATGSHALVFQSDGNLVVYDERCTPAWGLNVPRPSDWQTSASVSFQADGNLVATTAAGATLWQSGTAGHPAATLTLLPDGTLVVTDGGTELWRSR